MSNLQSVFSSGAKDDEQRLVERLRSGDNAAMREFYARYADNLASVCARYIADEEDLKDLFQDALVSIFTHVGDFRYRGQGSLQAWATKIVVNTSLKFLKTQRHELHLLDEEWPATADSLSTPDAALLTQDDESDEPPINDVPPDVIHQMVSRLPVGYRTVFNLYVFEGHSHSEIAQLLGISKSTSTSQLHRAKRLMAQMITDYINHKQSSR